MRSSQVATQRPSKKIPHFPRYTRPSAEDARGLRGSCGAKRRARAPKSLRPSPLQAKPTRQDAAAQHPSQAGGGVADRKPGTEAGRWEVEERLRNRIRQKKGSRGKALACLPLLPSTSSLCYRLSSLPLARFPTELPGAASCSGSKGKPWSSAREHRQPAPVAGRRRPLRMHLPG